MSAPLAPPIKCQGIKTKLVAWINSHANYSMKGRWVEPFMGSGVVGFNAQPQKALFGDSNPHIIGFYNALKTGGITPAGVRAYLEHEGAILSQKGEEHYYKVRERFNAHHSPLDFLFLSRACFNGVMRFNKSGQFNVPFGHKNNRFAKAYVTKITNQVKQVVLLMQNHDWEFVCADYQETIGSARKGDFVYCDPPYLGRHADYHNSWTENDEATLHRLLLSSPAKFILSTWHSNEYRHNRLLDDLWSDCHVITREHFYHVGGSEDNRNPMIEALVMNYVPAGKPAKLIEQTALF